MVGWTEILGFALVMFGIVVMPVFAVQQLYASPYVGFPIAVALLIVLTDAGVYVHSISERSALKGLRRSSGARESQFSVVVVNRTTAEAILNDSSGVKNRWSFG